MVEHERDRAMEDAIIKTVAAFLNSDGGTLLIGVRNDRTIHGLADDYAQVKPPNADGFVGRLDTMLENAVGKSAASRVSIRIEEAAAAEVCRIDVPPASRPTWAKTSNSDRIFFRRRNNSTVSFGVGDDEACDEYIADRWPHSAVPMSPSSGFL